MPLAYPIAAEQIAMGQNENILKSFGIDSTSKILRLVETGCVIQIASWHLRLTPTTLLDKDPYERPMLLSCQPARVYYDDSLKER